MNPTAQETYSDDPNASWGWLHVVARKAVHIKAIPLRMPFSMLVFPCYGEGSFFINEYAYRKPATGCGVADLNRHGVGHALVVLPFPESKGLAFEPTVPIVSN